MNFIDKALESHLHGDDFLQEMANIYKETEVWQELHRYPQYIRDVICIIDYDIELQMDGLASIFFGSIASRIDDIIVALDNCGAFSESDILMEARTLDTDDESFDEKIEYLSKKTALYNEYDEFWNLVRNYIVDKEFMYETERTNDA